MNLSGLDPFPVLTTERLVLRQMRADDATDALAVFGDPQVTATTDIEAFERVEQVAELIEGLNARYANRQAIRWAITRKDEDKLIGTGGFNYFDPETGRCEVGYDIAHAYWGQGLTTEAMQAVLKFGFEQIGVNRVEATTNLFNVASIRVLHKLGFREEGILYQFGYWRGQHHDLRMFSRLKRDWDRGI